MSDAINMLARRVRELEAQIASLQPQAPADGRQWKEIALKYRPPADGWKSSNDHTLERLHALASMQAEGTPTAAQPEEEMPDIVDAVMDPNGVCPTCFQPLHIDAAQPSNAGEADDVAYEAAMDAWDNVLPAYLRGFGEWCVRFDAAREAFDAARSPSPTDGGAK